MVVVVVVVVMIIGQICEQEENNVTLVDSAIPLRNNCQKHL
jgi:hypothetical protein